ncbi:MAG: aldo/keto reductase [Candidatus Puniceispirillaceae bacterium]
MVSTRSFGPQNLAASGLCFGAMQFGAGASPEDSAAMYAACRDAGINFFDTAYVYTQGRSEEILGTLIAKEREDIILVTKAGAEGGCSAKNIRTQLEASLTRLNQDYTDIFFLHRFDDEVPLEQSFAELAALKEQGKFYHLGVSNFAAWQVMKAQGIANLHGYPAIEILQPMYNLVKRQAEVEILPMAAAEELAVISYSPLGGGLLTGKYRGGIAAEGRFSWDQKYATRYGQDWMHQAANQLFEIAAEVGTAPAALAVAWVAKNPAITAPIISARNIEQLAPSLAATEIHLEESVYARLNALVPTPPPATDRLEEQG